MAKQILSSYFERLNEKYLTAERLRGRYHYDPATGIFTHAHKNGEHAAGDHAGWVSDTDGTVMLSVYGKMYKGHRLAWLYVTGEWPPERVVCENGVKHDIRWSNINHGSIA